MRDVFVDGPSLAECRAQATSASMFISEFAFLALSAVLASSRFGQRGPQQGRPVIAVPPISSAEVL